MIHGIRYVRQDIGYISKKHSCPICNTTLNTIKVSKIINSNSQEAKDIPPIIPRTVINTRDFKLRKYTAVGNIKWIWKEFECPNCYHRFTVEQMKQIEASPEECREEIIASFDRAPQQTDDEISKKQINSNCQKSSRKSLKLALCITIPVFILAFIFITVMVLSTSESDFVDTNGPDNFALVEITRDDILKKNNNYKGSAMSQKHSGTHTNIIGTRLRDCDYDNISVSFEKIYGVLVLQATKISGNTLTLNISSSVESGNAEIVIQIDGEYYCSVDVNKNQSVTLQDIYNKEIIVKFAGENATAKIDISRVY